MQQNIEIKNEDEVVNIFVPMSIRRRGNSVTVIVKNTSPQDRDRNFKNNMIKSFAKAHKWKSMLESGDIKSLADISRKEGVGTAHISRIFNLNFIAPEIIRRIFDGTQPRDLRLRDLTHVEFPLLWNEKIEKWGF